MGEGEGGGGEKLWTGNAWVNRGQMLLEKLQGLPIYVEQKVCH